jgi:hypothetical protein
LRAPPHALGPLPRVGARTIVSNPDLLPCADEIEAGRGF